MPNPFQRTEQRTAIKRHRCSVCSEPILPGQDYWSRFGRIDYGKNALKGQVKICDKCAVKIIGIKTEEELEFEKQKKRKLCRERKRRFRSKLKKSLENEA